MSYEKYKNVDLEILESRWCIRFKITHQDGKVETLVAESGYVYTDHDGIWFGTEEEHEGFPDKKHW